MENTKLQPQSAVKAYFNRVFSGCTKAELVYWWILRGLMIYGIFKSLLFGDDYLGSAQPLQMSANLVGMFAYEICQMFPKKSRMRLLPAYVQNITILGFFLASFCGAYLNFYYAVPGFDKILHATGTVEAVYIGYEYVSITQLKLKKTCPYQIAALCALGLGFIFACSWEMFEFIYDQFFGGDAQHWSYANAVKAAGGDESAVFHLFTPNPIERFALMDTMGDMTLNFIGGFIMYFILCIFPYRHKGKRDINAKIEAEIAEEAQQTANERDSTCQAVASNRNE